MSNRVGYIFHEDFDNFSPLLYVGNGGYGSYYQLKTFINQYLEQHGGDTSNGMLFSADATLYDFIIHLGYSPTSCRLKNLNNEATVCIRRDHIYKNCFDSGCYIVNVSHKSFGEIDGDGHDFCDWEIE